MDFQVHEWRRYFDVHGWSTYDEHERWCDGSWFNDGANGAHGWISGLPSRHAVVCGSTAVCGAVLYELDMSSLCWWTELAEAASVGIWETSDRDVGSTGPNLRFLWLHLLDLGQVRHALSQLLQLAGRPVASLCPFISGNRVTYPGRLCNELVCLFLSGRSRLYLVIFVL